MESSSSERVEMPATFEDAPVEHLVQLIADMMQRLIAHNDRIPLSPESLTRFHSRSAPTISVIDYLKRIVRFANVEKACLLATLFNIDQICARMPLFILSSLTCHRFIITSITVSSKALCDVFCSNNHYARVGGITVAELNLLEREFLAMIEWRLMCNRDILQEYYVNLVRTHSCGRYYISSPSISWESDDQDMDSGQSRPASPTDTPPCPHHPHHRLRCSSSEPSAILVEPGTAVVQDAAVAQRPTIAQNMAFAALQQSQDFHTLSADRLNRKP